MLTQFNHLPFQQAKLFEDIGRWTFLLNTGFADTMADIFKIIQT